MAFTPATPLEMVEALYIGYFGRAGEPGGVQYWVDQIQAGRTFAQVAAAFSVQQEAKDQHPFLANPDLVNPGAFVDSLYSQLLGRDADATGRAYWVAQASAAVGNPFAVGLLVAQFISGAQGDDITVLQNKIDAAEYFTGKLATANIQGVDANGQVLPDVDVAATNVITNVTKDTATVEASKGLTDTYVGSAANPGTTFTLKVDIETLDGTTKNDTFTGVINDNGGDDKSTFQTGDILNGNGGTDTLRLLVVEDNGPIVELNSVENVIVRSLEAGATVDASSWTGTTTLSSEKSTESVAFTGVQNAVIAKAVDADEGSTGDLDITYADNALDSDEAVQKISVSGVGDKDTDAYDIRFYGGGTDKITSLEVEATGAASYIDVWGTLIDGFIETLTVTGTGAVEIEDDAGAFVEATTIDLSANTGGVTLESANADVEITGGAGADIITLSAGAALSDKANIELGAGDDSLLDGGSGGVGTDALIDGGDGKDTISSQLLEVGNIANIKNWEIMDLAGESRTIDAALFTGSKFESLAISAALGGDVVINNLAGTAINVDIAASGGAGNDLTATLKDSSGTADTATLNFADEDGVDVTLAKFVTTGVETISIVSGGEDDTTANELSSLVVTNNTLAKITITGANDFTLGSVVTNSTATAPAPTTTVSALTEIDASAATGDITIGVNGSVTNVNVTTTTAVKVTTGSGDDTIDVGGKGSSIFSGTGADSITLYSTGSSADVGVDDDIDTVDFAVPANALGVALAGPAFTATGTAFTATSGVTQISNLAEDDVINVRGFFETVAEGDAVDEINDFTDAALLTGSLVTAVNNALADNTAEVDFINWVDGNTYIVVNGTNADGAGTGTNFDAVIRLVGTYEDFSVTNGLITIA